MIKRALSILCCTGWLYAVGTPADSGSLPPFQVSTDLPLLLLGGYNAGVEFIASRRVGLYAAAAGGSMAFTDITAWYQAQARYYLVNRTRKGIFLFLSVSRHGIEYNGEKASATSVGWGAGFKWIKWTRLLLEANLALSVSPDPRASFTEMDNTANRRVHVGGFSLPWATAIGFVF